MQKQISAEMQLQEHMNASGELKGAETRIIGEIIRGLTAQGGFVSNKAIILKLLERLETEQDVIMLDIYRNALEMIVQHTPDDHIG
ncbi:biofilm/acid-resistance regulator YmgB/AriR [Erwinia sp. E_sp_B01_3]|uniref:biofilm/acid-resistance regulator YmgB/AriR n=1 Tax=unclassified Erwinia TaxID=2622719 RepID=UPI0030CEA1FB